MAIFAALRNDGLLSVATEVLYQPTNLIQRAIDGDGGIATNWQVVTLTEQQYEAVKATYPGRAYLSGGNVTAKSLALSSNKAQITADGIDSATLTADTGDVSYTGNVEFTVTAPDGTVLTENVACIAGVASTSMTTTQVDMHNVKAECVEFGSDEITVEGI